MLCVTFVIGSVWSVVRVTGLVVGGFVRVARSVEFWLEMDWVNRGDGGVGGAGVGFCVVCVVGQVVGVVVVYDALRVIEYKHFTSFYRESWGKVIAFVSTAV